MLFDKQVVLKKDTVVYYSECYHTVIEVVSVVESSAEYRLDIVHAAVSAGAEQCFDRQFDSTKKHLYFNKKM